MCLPFTHRYGAWTDVQDKVSSPGRLLIQERRCETCNKAQRRQTLWLGGSGL